MPVLALLTEEQFAAVLAKQLPTEEPSLLQWTRSVGVEPSLPPDNITEALEGVLRHASIEAEELLRQSGTQSLTASTNSLDALMQGLPN